MALRYENANHLLVAALPELGPCYERFEWAWGNFGGVPPGSHIVYREIYQLAVGILLSLDPDIPGRGERLSACLSFADGLLQSGNVGLTSLAEDALSGSLLAHPAGPAAVATFGGEGLRRWFAEEHDLFIRRMWREEASMDWVHVGFGMWGVRDALSELLPETSTIELVGISHPAQHLALSSVDEAAQSRDGVVFISAFGISRPYVIAPAREVAAGEDTLSQLALDLAAHLGGEDQYGEPGARYYRIPIGERIWQMSVGDDEHARYQGDLWLADALHDQASGIVKVLRGREPRLPEPDQARES